ncbi:MAG: ribose-phosphate diphosphokinase [Oxalobacteraceae bacterium]
MHAEDVCFFALDADRHFGERVSQQAGVPVSPHEVREFEDGEHKIRPLVSVQGKDVFVLYSLYGDELLSADDKLCRLLFFIACLKDACAARVTALVPYLAYSRKDRKTQLRDPVTTQYIARLFEAVGTDAVVTIDVHNLAAFQNAFRCHTEHLEANPIFVAHIAALVPDAEVTVVSPDAGAMKRAEQFRQALSTVLQRPVGTGLMEKYRAQGAVTGEVLVGDMQGRVVVIVDDLISSGTTMQRAAIACRKGGASTVYAVATHGLLIGAASEVLAGSALDRVIIANTVAPFRISDVQALQKLTVLDCSKLFADVIRRIS